MFVLIRRRLNRRSRLDRLKDRARLAASRASDVAASVGTRAAALPASVNADSRTTTGGGLGLVIGLGLLALFRSRRQRDAEARRVQAEVEAAAARSASALRGGRARAWLATVASRCDGYLAHRDGSVAPPTWTIVAGAVAVVAVATVAVRRRGRTEMDWTGVGGSESAPAHGNF